MVGTMGGLVRLVKFSIVTHLKAAHKLRQEWALAHLMMINASWLEPRCMHKPRARPTMHSHHISTTHRLNDLPHGI